MTGAGITSLRPVEHQAGAYGQDRSVKISFTTAVSGLVIALALNASYKAIAEPNISSDQGRTQSDSISESNNFRPILTNRKVSEIVEDCSNTKKFYFCEQDIYIHLNINATPVSTGYKSIDESAPRDIKGYIYSMSTTGMLNEEVIANLDKWIATNLAQAGSDRYLAVYVPEYLQAAISPLLYPEHGNLYLVFNSGKIAASIVFSNSTLQSYKGLKYYDGGQYILQVGPIVAGDVNEFSEVFPLLVVGSESILAEWWPSGIKPSKLTSVSFY